MKTRASAADRPRMKFADAQAWSKWLHANHDKADGVWLEFAKKASGTTTVSYAEALEVALCYGWIDGQVRRLDESYYQQMFTPRTATSIWSKVNRAKALALIAAGRMQPAGLAAVEQAKKNGRWEAAYDGQSDGAVPEELTEALKTSPSATEFFATLDRKNRYAMIFRIQTAKKPETRLERARKFVAMLEREEKFHP